LTPPDGGIINSGDFEMWFAIGFVIGVAVGAYLEPTARAFVKAGVEYVKGWFK
jgi:Na+/H+-dicarboxylate symporter